MEYKIQTQLGGYRTVSTNGLVVASFTSGDEGGRALDAFIAGVSAMKSGSVYDADAGQYIVGTLAQLADGA